MKKTSLSEISLSAILLFCLVTPFIMTYRLGSGETPYWLFGLIFSSLLAYLTFKKARNFLLWLIIFLVIGGAVGAAMVVRHQTAPVYQVHDIILQQESAIQFFLQGKNPYASTYFGTPLEEWHYSATEINPALFHFVMMPWYFLFSLPFYFFSLPVFGFFDGRMPLLFLFFLLLFLAWKLLKGKSEQRRLFLTLLAFNPATLGYFLEGRADVFMFAFLFWGFYLLEKKRYLLAGIPLALAFATKQSCWPLFPFYLAFLWLKSKKDWQQTLKKLLLFMVVFGLVVLPFFFWDSKAFLESTIFYLIGQAEHSYPVSGYGWAMVLGSADYSSWLWQIIFGLPLLVILLKWLAKKPKVSRLIACYALFTFVFWYFSRYFNNSHVGYLTMVFLTAFFWPQESGIIKK